MVEAFCTAFGYVFGSIFGFCFGIGLSIFVCFILFILAISILDRK